MSSICPQCDNHVTRRQQQLKCKACNILVHRRCQTAITRVQFFGDKQHIEAWHCTSCMIQDTMEQDTMEQDTMEVQDAAQDQPSSNFNDPTTPTPDQDVPEDGDTIMIDEHVDSSNEPIVTLNVDELQLIAPPPPIDNSFDVTIPFDGKDPIMETSIEQDLDVVNELDEERPYEIIKGGTKHGNDLLICPREYSYYRHSAKRQNYWHCIKMRSGGCNARVKQILGKHLFIILFNVKSSLIVRGKFDQIFGRLYHRAFLSGMLYIFVKTWLHLQLVNDVFYIVLV